MAKPNRVVLELEPKQAEMLLGFLANALVQLNSMIRPVLEACRSKCEAQNYLCVMGETVDRSGEIARMLPRDSVAWQFYARTEYDLIERLDSLIRANEHIHDEVDNHVQVH
jgi:hypothetical protein